ncbi:MAG TPA: hypothetical protein IAD16_09560 [Candidatus Fimisoma avicola]|uniref:YitT family protein n=1 Tax=Candidatus Fimisoma avicola TaxID=2840826 RepID=A0A9D1I5W2_9FIRM|nr:hypothetical protein [Candidatus Fimisoma avicola]
MKEYTGRTIRLIFGLVLYGLGSYMSIQANVGLAPWDAFSMGISYKTGIMYGNVVVYTGFLIIIIDFLLKEKIGFGTIINAILIGKVVDLCNYLGLLPMLDNFAAGVAMLFAGQVVICLGSYFYIGAAMGCGPRDALMVAMGKRFSRLPIGLVRGILEGTVLLLGWLMGAKVGIGTIIAVFGIGTIMEYTFRILKFDVKGVRHENFADTVRRIRSGRHTDEPTQEQGV